MYRRSALMHARAPNFCVHMHENLQAYFVIFQAKRKNTEHSAVNVFLPLQSSDYIT